MNKAWQAFPDHVRLSVRLTPNGGRDAIDGLETVSDGECYLKARVSVAPEKGKANKALIALLSKSLGLPKSTLSIISGDTARKKNPPDRGRAGGFDGEIEPYYEGLIRPFPSWRGRWLR